MARYNMGLVTATGMGMDINMGLAAGMGMDKDMHLRANLELALVAGLAQGQDMVIIPVEIGLRRSNYHEGEGRYDFCA